MTPEELDRQLRTLSDHERLYREGAVPAPEQHRFVEVGGQQVMLSRFHAGKPGTFGIPSAFIRAKRHSRFRNYPLHMHDFVELAYMYSGHCLEVVNDGILDVAKGQVLLVDSDTVHTIQPLSEDDILVNVQIDKRYFDTSFFSRFDSDSIVTSFFVRSISKGAAHDSFILFPSQESRRLPLFMNELLCEAFDPSPRSEEMADALLTLVLAELVNVGEQNASSGTAPIASPALDVLRYIEANYRTCTLSGCARELGMSTSYITKMLRSECGQTFKELVQKQRIMVAERLIAGGVSSIADVASEVGYQNMSYFYKIFERECGMLPGAWRQHCLEQAQNR